MILDRQKGGGGRDPRLSTNANEWQRIPSLSSIPQRDYMAVKRVQANNSNFCRSAKIMSAFMLLVPNVLRFRMLAGFNVQLLVE